MPHTKTDIVILGAGIGGVETFRTLNAELKRAGLKKTITIVDRNNYFTFVPLLHEVATGAVEPTHAAVPLRELVYKTPHQFLKAEIQKIIPTEKKVITSEGEISYDYCVLALGADVNFYGVTGAKEHSFTIRTLTEAMNARQAIINKIEGSDNTTAITVVGGGYTGVEMAGQLADFIQHDLKKLYPDDTITLSIVQNVAELVTILPPKARRLATARLKKMGVKVFLNAQVKEVTDDTLVLDKDIVPSDITIWCAGNLNDLTQIIDPAFCSKGRLPLTHYLNHALDASLYGVGDSIMAMNEDEEMPYPQLGEAAENEGHYVAKHIVATMRGKQMKPFYFRSVGTIMPIGERWGMVVFKGFVFSGLFAWWIRRTVYLMFIPGFSRKLRIVIDWTLRLFGFRYTMEINRDQTIGK